MNLIQLVSKIRRYTRDDTGSLSSHEELVDFINEGLDRIKKIQVLVNMRTLVNNNDEINLLPKQYHYLVSVYGASRAFTKDEQHYQASQFMSEFEQKLAELERDIESGKIVITDENGEILLPTGTDGVVDVYFKRYRGDSDVGD